MNESSSTLDKFFKTGVGLLAWGLIFWGILQLAGFFNIIVVVFGLALMFAYILLAPVNLVSSGIQRLLVLLSRATRLQWPSRIAHTPTSRALSILLVYLAFLLTTLVVSVRFMPVAITQLNQFSLAFPQYIHQVEDWVMSQRIAEDYFHKEVAALRSRGELSKPQERMIDQETAPDKPQAQLTPTEKQVVREKILSTSQHVNNYFKRHLGGTFQSVVTLVTSTLAGFIYTLTGMVLVFYFLLDGKNLKEGFVRMLPLNTQVTADYLLSNVHMVMFGFIKGQVMLGIATGIYMIIIYSLFDVPYAFFLGAFFAVAEILPVVGTWLGFLPGILVLLFINPIKLLMVMALVYIYQVIKDNVVAPRVLGQVMGLHPVVVIVSILICAKGGGLFGILFAIPLASMVNVLIRFLSHKEFINLNRR